MSHEWSIRIVGSDEGDHLSGNAFFAEGDAAHRGEEQAEIVKPMSLALSRESCVNSRRRMLLPLLTTAILVFVFVFRMVELFQRILWELYISLVFPGLSLPIVKAVVNICVQVKSRTTCGRYRRTKNFISTDFVRAASYENEDSTAVGDAIYLLPKVKCGPEHESVNISVFTHHITIMRYRP
jgi:hypothetical protein